MSATPPPPPPPPPSPDGGTPPPPTGGYSVSDAFNFGWTKFQQNVGAWLGGTIVLFLIGVAIQVVFRLISAAFFIAADAGNGTTNSGVLIIGSIGTLLLGIAFIVVGWIISVQFVRAGLSNTDTGRLEFGKFFDTRLLGPAILAALIVAVFTAIGFVLCIIPSLIVIFFAQYCIYFVLGEDMGPWDAIKASVTFVNKHLANILVLFLILCQSRNIFINIRLKVIIIFMLKIIEIYIFYLIGYQDIFKFILI